jgi:cbb3-type cytochrome oxidase subunit 3
MDWELLNYKIYQTRLNLADMMMTDWRHDITTPTYWGIVAFIILYYIIWYHMTDKKRLVDLMFYGSLIAVARGLIDLFGVSYGFWIYKYRILPLSPSVFLQDWTIMR